MPILVAILILLFILAIFFYPVYLGLYTHKDLILKRLASVDALLKKRQIAVLRVIDMVEEALPEQAVLISEIKNIIFDIKKLKYRWDNNEDRFLLENQLDTKLGTFLDIVMKTPNIYSNIYIQKEVNNFINVQGALITSVKSFNETLAVYKSLINSAAGKILAPKMRIKCNFIPYYVP